MNFASGALLLRPGAVLITPDSGLAADGNVLSDLVVSDADQLIVYAGGVVSSATITSGGYGFVSGGTIVAAVISQGGFLGVASGVASGSVVVGGGVLSGIGAGVMDNTTIAAGGTQYAYTVANHTLIESGGAQLVSGSADDLNDTIASGGVVEVDGGIASGITLQAGGLLDLYTQNAATAIAVAAGGTIALPVFQANTALAPSLSTRDVLTISGLNGSFSLQLAGNYANETFHLADDLSGTMITLSAVAGAAFTSAAHISAGEAAAPRLETTPQVEMMPNYFPHVT